MTYPDGYEWLGKLGSLPRVIIEALALVGTREIVGPKHNPIILAWAKEVGLGDVYRADEVPWCGLFVRLVCERAGKGGVAAPLWARNWARFGTKAERASLGDVLVFQRAGGGGHVGFYVAEDESAYHVLGGNQGDSVSIARIAKTRCIAARRPPFKVGMPASVRPYSADSGAALSTNEA